MQSASEEWRYCAGSCCSCRQPAVLNLAPPQLPIWGGTPPPPLYTYCIYTVTQNGGKMWASSQHLRTHCASPSARALQLTACRKCPLLSRSVREGQLFILMQFMSCRQNIEMRPKLPTDSTCFAAACILFSNFSCGFLLEVRAGSSVGRKKTVTPRRRLSSREEHDQ